MAGEPSFFELGVPHARRARAFFGALFGWTFDATRDDSAAIETGGVAGGVHGDDGDALIVVYFAVPDIEAAVRRVRELGGQAPEPGPDDGRFGRFVECKDDQGVRFGLRQLPAR